MADVEHIASVSSTDMVKANEQAIVLHTFSDLSRLSPLFFVHFLKQSYVYGKGKAVIKFQTLRRQVIEALPTAPSPGPATYVANCLNALILVSAPYDEGLSNLLTSALSSSKLNRKVVDDIDARRLASRLFTKAILDLVTLNEGIIVKLATVFKIEMRDLEEAASSSITEMEELEVIKARLEAMIFKFIRSHLYSSAVALLKQFSLQHSVPIEFLDAMIKDNHIQLAESWAVYMGKDMLVSLVERCIEMKLFKKAYTIVQKYGLASELPGVSYLYKKSALRKLASKGCWDLAEMKANKDLQLIKYMVDLAYESHDPEKAADLCHRYCLTDYHPVKGTIDEKNHYFELEDFVKEENILWIDDVKGLSYAKGEFSKLDVVGVDCEWRPYYVKANRANTVSILQIATGEKVFIFDLIKLSVTDKDALDACLKSVFHSSKIVKLGYAFYNDLEQLFYSYRELECFTYCEATLDLQKLSGTIKGGLSALTKSVLGRNLNKTRRMSNWDQRPLSRSQLHYAALDAAVLIAIFHVLCEDPSEVNTERRNDLDWRSQIVCCRNPLKHKKSERKHETTDSSETYVTKQLAHCQDDFVPGNDMDSTLTTRAEIFLPMHMNSESNAPEEELVYASRELFGLSRPGLLKGELQHYAQTAGTQLPIYAISQIAGPHGSKLYSCTVTIGTTHFCGRPARSKKAAEYWAAFRALTYIFEGRGLIERLFQMILTCNEVMRNALDPEMHVTLRMLQE